MSGEVDFQEIYSVNSSDSEGALEKESVARHDQACSGSLEQQTASGGSGDASGGGTASGGSGGASGGGIPSAPAAAVGAAPGAPAPSAKAAAKSASDAPKKKS